MTPPTTHRFGAQLPTVSVIVPVYNDADRLSSCLDALQAQDYPDALVEVIVVDNASCDRPELSVGARPGMRLLYEPRPGSYVARNAGMDTATGQVFAFTDSDCVPDPCWLRESVAALGRLGRPGRIGGRVTVFARTATRMSAVEAYEIVRAFPQQRYVENGFAVTANLVVDASVFELVGPFDPALRSGGDREWGERATAAGVPLTYADTAVVRHPARSTWSQLRDKLRRVTAGDRDAVRIGRRRGVRLGARVLRRGLLPPVAAVREARTDDRLESVRARMGFLAACFFVRYVGTFERLRVQRGDTSPR